MIIKDIEDRFPDITWVEDELHYKGVGTHISKYALLDLDTSMDEFIEL